MKELEEYMSTSFKDRKLEVINQVVEYLNHKYPNITVIYENNDFTISGDEFEAEECKNDIEEMLKFSAKEK